MFRRLTFLGSLVALLFMAPVGAKESDVTVCVVPVVAQVTKEPPSPGEFWTRARNRAAYPQNVDGYFGVACDVPGAQRLTFHHSFVGGWQPLRGE